MLAIFIEIVHLYAWASGAMAKFAGMPHKLSFTKKPKWLKELNLRKLPVKYQPCDVMRNADSFWVQAPFPIPVRLLYLCFQAARVSCQIYIILKAILSQVKQVDILLSKNQELHVLNYC